MLRLSEPFYDKRAARNNPFAPGSSIDHAFRHIPKDINTGMLCRMYGEIPFEMVCLTGPDGVKILDDKLTEIFDGDVHARAYYKRLRNQSIRHRYYEDPLQAPVAHAAPLGNNAK